LPKVAPGDYSCTRRYKYTFNRNRLKQTSANLDMRFNDKLTADTVVMREGIADFELNLLLSPPATPTAT
jgi:hypothetical protein